MCVYIYIYIYIYSRRHAEKGFGSPPVLCSELLDYDIGDSMIRRLVRRAFLRVAVRH